MKAPILRVVCFALAAAHCSPSASQVPLSNAEPEGNDVYFYGDASRGGKAPSDTEQDEEREQPRAQNKGPAEPAAERPKPSEPKDGESAEKVPEEEQVALPKLDAANLPGTYAGKDTLKIHLDGTPDRVETDPDAKLKVEAGDPDTFAFQILDSRSGDALCSVDGTVVDGKLHFEPGQKCLETILGIPMKATLKKGTAKLEGEKLTVDWDIELEVDAPGGSREGSIDYHFEGNRE